MMKGYKYVTPPEWINQHIPQSNPSKFEAGASERVEGVYF